MMGTYSFHYCPGVLGGDTYDGYIFFSLLSGILGSDTYDWYIFFSLFPGCSWKGHLRWVHILLITARVFLEETPKMGTYSFHYSPGVLEEGTYDGYIFLISVNAYVS
nr:hypothetical protein [Tanacetum cinerariifolium]